MVTLLLTIEADTVPVFTDLSSLAETYEESIIVPCLEGVDHVAQWCRVEIGHHLGWGGIQLGRQTVYPSFLLSAGGCQ